MINRKKNKERKLNAIKSTPDKRDFKPRAGLVGFVRAIFKTPKRFDSTYKMTRVKDQGREGSCTGFAAVSWIEALNSKVDLSERMAYENARKYDEWEGECVDESTECLCKTKGWVNYEQLEIGDEIFTLNMATEKMEWSEVKKVFNYNRKESEVVSLSCSTFEKVVTKNHRCVTYNRNRQNKDEKFYRTKLPQELVGADVVPKIEGGYEFPSTKKYDDDFVEICAWIFTEGHYLKSERHHKGHRPSKNNYIGVSQTDIKYNDKVKILVENFDTRFYTEKANTKNGICYTYVFTDASFTKRVKAVMPNKIPTMDFILSLTEGQLKLFVHTCILGDGSIWEPTKKRKGREVFYQKGKKGQDIFQVACSLLGICANVRQKKDESGVGVISLIRSVFYDIRRWKKKIVNFTGTVWCPQTDNNTFLARRNGMPFITGNSYSGSSLKGVLKGANKHGVCEERLWKYNDRSAGKPKKGYADNALDFRVGKYLLLMRKERPQINKMCTKLAEGYGVIASIKVTDRFMSMRRNSILMTPGRFREGGHAIAIVGYDKAKKLIKIRNSWSDEWGKDGYAYISFSAFKEMCFDLWCFEMDTK